MPDIDSVISRIALIVKRTYCLLRRRAQRIGRYDPPDNKYGKYWTAAAMLCVRNGINPSEFIEVQFYRIKPWPEISNICTELALNRFKEFGVPYAAAYANEFNIQIKAYERLVEIGKDPKAVLTDPDQGFDALFVYVVATINEFADLQKHFHDAALARYLTSVHHEQVYKDAIPEEFRQVAIKLRGDKDGHGLDGCAASASDQRSEVH